MVWVLVIYMFSFRQGAVSQQIGPYTSLEQCRYVLEHVAKPQGWGGGCINKPVDAVIDLSKIEAALKATADRHISVVR